MGLMVALSVSRFVPGATDSHGNPAVSYAAAVPWEVWGIAPGSQEEPGEANRDLSLIAWTVYAPKSDDVPGERDRVLVDGEVFEVAGRAQDWTRGPWLHPTAGVVVELTRAEG